MGKSPSGSGRSVYPKPPNQSQISNFLADSDIKMRRKVAFLLNTLLLQTDEPSAATASPQIVHANSHASMLSDPSAASTSALALRALKDNGVLDSVISGLVDFVPFGADGDGNEDLQFEETCIRYASTLIISLYTWLTDCHFRIRIVYTYSVSCEAPLTEEQKAKMAGFLRQDRRDEQGASERWGLVAEELGDLREKVGLSRA